MLAAVVFVAAVVVHYHGVQSRSIKRQAYSPSHKSPHRVPKFEVYPGEDIHVPKPIPGPKTAEPKTLPLVAIIIDDLGYNRALAKKFINMGASLTLSVLPHSPFQKMILREARLKGLETMLHLPMEPREYPRVDPGPGALLTSMSPDELIDQLNENLDALPTIKGVNNHMGSKMTAMSSQMYQIFSVLKKRNLYFIDSKTSADSLCRPSARLLKVRFAQRDVFLDHTMDPTIIKKQINKLIRIAMAHGQAIGIGHPHKVTYDILISELPRMKKKVRLVPASMVVHLVKESGGSG